jgi:hypothetical protein
MSKRASHGRLGLQIASANRFARLINFRCSVFRISLICVIYVANKCQDGRKFDFFFFLLQKILMFNGIVNKKSVHFVTVALFDILLLLSSNSKFITFFYLFGRSGFAARAVFHHLHRKHFCTFLYAFLYVRAWYLLGNGNSVSCIDIDCRVLLIEEQANMMALTATLVPCL